MEIKTKSKPAGLVVIRAVFQFIISLIIWGGLLFLSAGSIKWIRGWFHLWLWTVTLLANLFILVKMNPSLLVARTKRQRFESRFDLLLMLLIVTPAVLAVPVVAGLDAVRYRFLPIPFWAIIPAVLFHIAGDALIVWSMAVNPYLEKTIRIQSERGHHVVTTGPYAIVRHPMYTGVVLLLLGIPPILGSGWAFVPLFVVFAVLIVRSVLEERILLRDLPGYKEYAQRTRYRLVPGIW